MNMTETATYLSETLRRYSPREMYLSHVSKDHVEDVVATIDMDAFFKIRKEARDRTKTLNAIKYFNLKPYMHEQMKRALALNLTNARKSVLDIGTGFGYFPYICEFFGNHAVAIDVPGHELFDEVTDFLRVKKIHHRIEALQPLPAFDRKFNVASAFQVAFNRHDAKNAWEEKEWSYFLNDLFENVLAENGELLLQMNWDTPNRCWLTPGAHRALKAHRVQVSGARFHIRSR